MQFKNEKNFFECMKVKAVNETLSEIADSLVSAGIYQDPAEALLAIATDFIDRKIENYQ
jgi:hypothetical protein